MRQGERYSWWKMAEQYFRFHEDYCISLERLEADTSIMIQATLKSSLDAKGPIGKGSISDPTGRAGVRLAADTYAAELRRQTAAVGAILATWAGMANPAPYHALYLHLYKGRSIRAAAMEAHYSEDEVKHIKRAVFLQLAAAMGWDTEPLPELPRPPGRAVPRPRAGVQCSGI